MLGASVVKRASVAFNSPFHTSRISRGRCFIISAAAAASANRPCRRRNRNIMSFVGCCSGRLAVILRSAASRQVPSLWLTVDGVGNYVNWRGVRKSAGGVHPELRFHQFDAHVYLWSFTDGRNSTKWNFIVATDRKNTTCLHISCLVSFKCVKDSAIQFD